MIITILRHIITTIKGVYNQLNNLQPTKLFPSIRLSREKPEVPCKDCPCFKWATVFHPTFYLQSKFKLKDKRLDLLFIGEAPGTTELKIDRQFSGQAGNLLSTFIKNMNIPTTVNFALTNACRCSKGSSEDQKPPAEAIANCAYLLQEELLILKPKNIIILGDVALQTMLGLFPDFLEQAKQISQRLKITELENAIIKTKMLNCKSTFVAMLHPSYYQKPGHSNMIYPVIHRYKKLGKELFNGS